MAKEKNQAETETQEPEKKSGKLKKFLILGLPLLIILGGGGYFGYNYFLKPANKDSGPLQNSTFAQDKESAQYEPKMVSLPSLLVNLADPLGKRYLKLTVNLEVKGQKAAEKVQESMPKIKDSLIMLLSSKSYEQLSSIKNKIILKKEIVERLNQIMGKPLVIRVYFVEFVVQ